MVHMIDDFENLNKLRESFKENGFVLLKHGVDSEVLSAVKKEISGLNIEFQEEYGKLRKDRRYDFLEELSPSLLSYYNQTVLKIGQIFLGKGNRFVDAQISIIENGREKVKDWHIDGTWIAKKNNSFAGIPFFKLLVGVFLSDLTQAENGNLMISPGGHLSVQDFFKSLSPEDLNNPVKVFEKLSKIEIPHLIPILAEPGDIIIAHCLLPHNIDHNQGNERRALYFRLGAYETDGYRALSNLWSDWDI